MPIVNYVREHIRFMEYAADEHLSASERLLWYALMHIMNQRAQANIWPDEFIRISNDRLLSYCPMKFDTMATARNGLKQRGLIEFTKGEKNKLSPSYRMIYFYPQYVAPSVENDGDYTIISDNMGGNTGDNMGGNIGYNQGSNPVGNPGDIKINNTYTESNSVQNIRKHTRTNVPQGYTPRAGENGYIGLDGEIRACRYDSAWKTSARARGAVAQRVIEGIGFACLGDELHERLTGMMALGMPPELMEDAAAKSASESAFKAALDRIAEKRGYTQEAGEWSRCLSMARGNEDFAQRLYRMRSDGQEEKAQ